jgi:hypothetical protein
MTLKNLTPQSINSAPLGKRMLLGAAIALLVIAAFLLSVNHPQPVWGKLWMIRPLIITPLAGAMGGVFFYLVNHVLNQNGWQKALAIIIGSVGYLIALWLGTVLGLAGTLWN